MSDEALEPAESAERRKPGRSPSTVLERLRSQAERAGRYTSREEIARGGMGAIVRVWDGDLQRQLAMKVMLGASKEHTGSASAAASEGRRVARFLDEAHITGQLDHPGIVPVHEIGLDERGQLYFTMRLVKGRELREVFELVPANGEGWTLTRALGVILKVCEAMAFAHEKGVIHRDLKPANVMVGRFGEVYVMDWGLAKVLGRDDAHDVRLAQPDVSQTIVRSARSEMVAEADSPLSTMDGDIVGTPCYMAPEQARGRLDDIGPQSDVYSVGSMLYELLGGEKPYCPENVQPSPSAVLGALMHGAPRALALIRKDLPDELVAISEKAMARDTRERYASMLDMAEDLRAFLEGRVVKAYEAGPVAEFKKWIARNKAFAGAIAAALVIALLGLGVALSVQHAANVDLRAANSVIEDRNRNLQEQERETRSAYDQLSEAITEQERINKQLRDVSLQERASAALAQRRGYAASIAAADGALRALDSRSARRLLDEGCEAELRGWEWRHLKSRCDESARALTLAGAPLETLAASADGRWIAVAFESDKQHAIQLCDAETGAIVRELGLQNALVLALAFDTSGRRLASLSSDRKVHIHDTERGTVITSWSERLAGAPNLEFTPDGASVLTATGDETARLRDSTTGAIVREFTGLPKRVARMRLAPTGQRFAAASRDGSIAIVSTASGAREFTLEQRGGPIFALAFDNTGSRLLAAGGHARDEPGAPTDGLDRAVSLWSVEDGTLVRTFAGHDDRVLWCGFRQDGRSFISVSADRTVRVWDIASGACDVRLGHDGRIVAAASLGDGERIVTADNEGLLRTWDWSAGSSFDIDEMQSGIELLAFSFDGRMLVAAGQDGLVRAFDARTGYSRWVNDGLVKLGFAVGRVRALASSPTQPIFAIASNQRRIRVRDFDTGAPLGELDDDGTQVTALAYSHDGTRLAAGTSIGNVRVYSTATLALELSLPTGESISSLAWSSDGRTLVVATLQGALQAWQVADLTHADLAARQSGYFASVAIERSSPRLLTRAGDTLELWSEPTLQSPRRRLSSTPGEHLELLGDGMRFVTCNSRGVTAHEIESLEPLLELRREASGPTALATSRSADAVAAGFPDGLVRVWFATSANERFEMRRSAGRARELALPMVEELFSKELDCSAAIASLTRNEAISETLRSAAINLVRGCDAKVEFLLREARSRAAARDLPTSVYRLAVWQARLARKQMPTDHRALVAEGALAYRLRDFTRASELLRQALQEKAERRIEPEIAGYLALSELALERVEEAQAPLAEFRELMRTVEINSRDPANVELLREVEREAARARN